ncbi:MAG: chromosomal replication initiator protein DnaA [Patescibacteria group bacterium]|nr:chromosomal replication initiator protein DnaA [Patescibacteria group bacterium]
MQRDGLWQAVLGEIELTVSRGNFVTWFKPTQLLSHTDTSAVIGVPNVFIKQQLERKYNDLIRSTLEKNGVLAEVIEYKMSTMAPSARTFDESVLAPNGQQTADRFAPPRSTSPVMTTGASGPHDVVTGSAGAGTLGNGLTHSYRQGINERYTFDNFIVGSGNELAFAACQSIAQMPGTKYNPLFLYGGVGIGKTHLIQAVGNAVKAQNPKAKILYISTEQFVQEFVAALRFRKTADFASYYRSADVLIVDDIQFIAGKEKMQEEFFHTFNALHQANKQIIISSDKPPKDIATLEERLQSRFAWGMSIDMQIPDFETRCAIVQTKAQTHEVELPADVVEYLANHIQTNIRELEGALNQLLAFCEMRNLEPSLSVAGSLLGSAKVRPKHLSAKQIIERTCKHFQIPMEDILGPKRDKDIVVPRQIAMYMLRSELHLSFPKIARELGRKDHTTAIHSVEKITKESQLDADLRSTLSEIKERLYA